MKKDLLFAAAGIGAALGVLVSVLVGFTATSNALLEASRVTIVEGEVNIGCWSRERRDATGKIGIWKMIDGSIAYGTHIAPHLGCGSAYGDAIEVGEVDYAMVQLDWDTAEISPAEADEFAPLIEESIVGFEASR